MDAAVWHRAPLPAPWTALMGLASPRRCSPGMSWADCFFVKVKYCSQQNGSLFPSQVCDPILQTLAPALSLQPCFLLFQCAKLRYKCSENGFQFFLQAIHFERKEKKKKKLLKIPFIPTTAQCNRHHTVSPQVPDEKFWGLLNTPQVFRADRWKVT